MLRTVFKSKLHRATVTQACLDYVGSITIDEDLMDAADILINEQVAVVDINNGERLETYAIPGPRGSGVICLNGAAARLVQPGDKVIIITYAVLDNQEAKTWKPTVAFLNDANQISELKNEEKHGEIRK
jgi:aspartate 1-decarboxylase